MGKKLPVFSPTGLRMLEECPRKWAFRYIDRVELDPEDAPWKEQGTRMHAHLERAKLTGETPPQDDPEARVASAAIQYWPDFEWTPEAEIKVDRGFWTLKGKSDQIGFQFVGDYKFTGNKKNLPERRPYWEKLLWPRSMKGVSDDQLIAEAVEALRDDTQPIGYGAAADHWSGVFYRWTYVIKPPKLEGQPKVLVVDFEKTTEEIEEGVRRLDKIAAVGIYLKENFAEASEVLMRPQACGGLGISCDYAEHCKLTKGPAMAKKEATIDDIMNELGINDIGGNSPEARKQKPLADDEDEDEDDEAPKRKRRKPSPEPEEDDEDEPEEKPKRRKRPAPEPEDDEDEEDEPKPVRKRRKPEPEEDDEEDEPEEKPKRGPGRPRKARPTKDEEPKRKPGRPRKQPEPEEDDEDDDSPETFKIFGIMNLGGKKFFVVAAGESDKTIGDEIG